MEEPKKTGTRIFKKSTPNGKLTVYLGKRDFIDHLTHVDPIEGVVLLDPAYVKDRKVFVHLLGAFRCGRDDSDLLSLACHRDLYASTKQVYPPLKPGHIFTTSNGGSNGSFGSPFVRRPPLEPPNLTRLQERLIRKLGTSAYPFFFQLPAAAPASVTLMMSSSDGGKPCRVDYELKVYVADDEDQKPQKRNSVRLAIRKLTYAAPEPGPQPSTEISRDFLMSLGSLRLEVSLDKQNYYHGESLSVNILVDNNSTKTVKRIKLSVRQYTQVYLHHLFCYKYSVAEIQSDEGFPILPSQTGWCKVYSLCPSAANRDKIGVAMDGDLKHEDTNLASSTSGEAASRELLGIVVQYKVKVRLVLGFGISDVCLELPFTLTHPNPEVEDQSDLPDVVPQSVVSSVTVDAPAASIRAGAIVEPALSLVTSCATSNQLNTKSVEATSNLLSLYQGQLDISQMKPPSISCWEMPVLSTTQHGSVLQSAAAMVDTVATSYAMTSSQREPGRQLHHRESTTGTASTISDDELSFEDFARLRLTTASAAAI